MAITRFYTVQEAQEKLREIRPLVSELRELKAACHRRGYDVYRHQYFGGMGPNGQKVFPSEMERIVVIVQALDADGIQVKDLDRGLIDFPHRRANGEIVLLCYLDGEPEIVQWHPLEGGFRDRRDLSEL